MANYAVNQPLADLLPLQLARWAALPNAGAGGIIPNPVAPLFSAASMPNYANPVLVDNGSHVVTISFSLPGSPSQVRDEIRWDLDDSDTASLSYNTIQFNPDGMSVFEVRNGQTLGIVTGNFVTPLSASDKFKMEAVNGAVELTQNGQRMARTGFSLTNGTKVLIQPTDNALTAVNIGQDVTPLVVTKTEILTDRRVRVFLNYVGSPNGWETSNQTGSGGILAPFEDTSIISSEKGKMVLETKTPFPASQLGNSVKLIIRAKNNTGFPVTALSTVLGGSKRLAIGQNVAGIFYTNKAGSWQDRAQYGRPDGGYLGLNDGVRKADGNILSSGPVDLNMRCARPDSPGLEQMALWEEPGNTTGVSDWSVFGASEKDPTRTTWESTSRGYNSSTGKFFYRGIPVIDYNRPGDEPFVVFSTTKSGARINNFQYGNVGADFSKPFTDEFLKNLIGVYEERATNPYPMGPIRTMESMQINAWRQDFAWADRPRPGVVTTATGESIESHIAWHRASRRPFMFIIGYRWPEETIKKYVRAMFTGEGLLNGGIGMRSDGYMHLSLVGNEPWNVGLTGLYGQIRADGYARVLAEEGLNNAGADIKYGGENFLRLKEQTHRHNQVLAWVQQAIPEFMDRVIITFAASPGQHWFEYNVCMGYGIQGVQAVESSIYVGIDAKTTNYGSNTPAELFQPWLDDVDIQMARALANFNDYKAAGVRRTIYEIGMDNFPSNRAMTEAQAVAWAKSPEYLQVYRKAWTRMMNEFGDDCAIYTDVDSTETYWGHYARNVSRRKWDLVLDIQSQVVGA